MADKENGMFESFSKASESMMSLEGAKKAAAWYIDNSEKLAKQAIELQGKGDHLGEGDSACWPVRDPDLDGAQVR